MPTPRPAPRPTDPARRPRWLAARRLAVAAAAALSLLGVAHGAPTYSATILALPEQTSGSRAFGLSGGVVVGQVTGADGLPRAVVWADPATPQFLSAGAFESTALAIAGSRMAGSRADASDPAAQQALRWANAGATAETIGSAGGHVGARAVAGMFTAGSGTTGAFVHDAFTNTVASFDAPGAVAHGVTAAGVAVGQDAAGLPVVFNGAKAGFIDVLGSAGDAEGSAFAVLDDIVVGSFDDPDTGDQRAFRMKLGSSSGTTLFNGAAFALNALGDVVGADFDLGVAMLYSGSTAYDLNSLVGSGLGGFTLTQARAIDEQGRIVAFGVDALGQERSFLLSPGDGGPPPPPPPPPPPNPMPEPGTALLLLAALAALRQKRR